MIGIADGRIAGGFDACNSWGFGANPQSANGERIISSTMVACEDDPLRRAYWVVGSSDVRPELRPDGRLRLRARGHQIALRRCEWQEVSEANSRGTRCLAA